MPTVRVDNEVWQWLQRHARPFEDTPNTVLRRLAGLDEPTPAEASEDGLSARLKHSTSSARDGGQLGHRTVPNPRHNRQVTGESLNRRHHLGLRHALYHKDGTFYERLARFPGGLCDPTGYVRFDTEHQFTQDSRISVGQKVNVQGGIASHPRYLRFKGE